ncbi:hypothetical protein PIB30_100521 [Stylosanthes scabra]|uniref:Uncharacterized protein n=1 Tax=Stylosanthes scabra TaxID=79078 RepID=A0ABU6VVX7_9FABA|nr:hypothetical protein [Stylosanthes scabra]
MGTQGETSTTCVLCGGRHENHSCCLTRKIEERKLADQETEFGSKIEQSSTHMRGMRAAHTQSTPK